MVGLVEPVRCGFSKILITRKKFHDAYSYIRIDQLLDKFEYRLQLRACGLENIMYSDFRNAETSLFHRDSNVKRRRYKNEIELRKTFIDTDHDFIKALYKEQTGFSGINDGESESTRVQTCAWKKDLSLPSVKINAEFILLSTVRMIFRFSILLSS